MCHELGRKKECKFSTWSLPISLPILHLYPGGGGGWGWGQSTLDHLVFRGNGGEDQSSLTELQSVRGGLK